MKDFVSKHKKIIIVIGSLVIAVLVICACFLFGGSKDKDSDNTDERTVYSITNNNSADKNSEVVDSDTEDMTSKEDKTESTTSKITTENKTEKTTEVTSKTTTEDKTDKNTEKKTDSTTKTEASTKETSTEKQTEYIADSTTERRTEATTERQAESTTNEQTTEKKTESTTNEDKTTSEKTEENKTEHVCNYELVETVEATCTTDGKKTYKCSGCGKTKSEVIKATGHNYKCTVTEATCDKDGKKVYKCSKCGDTYSETIPSGNHSWGETWEEEDVHYGTYDEVIHYILDDGTDITALGWTIEDWSEHEKETGEFHAYWTTTFYHWTSDEYTIINTYHKCSKCGKTELVDTQTVYYHRAGDMTRS